MAELRHIVDVLAQENPRMNRELYSVTDRSSIEVNMDNDHGHCFPWESSSDEQLNQLTSELSTALEQLEQELQVFEGVSENTGADSIDYPGDN